MTQDMSDEQVRKHHRYRNLWDDFQTVEKDLRGCALLIGHHYNSLRPVSDALKRHLEAQSAHITRLAGARFDELVSAYRAGAEDVHRYWAKQLPEVERQERQGGPDFTEAAHEYALAALEALRNTATEAVAGASQKTLASPDP